MIPVLPYGKILVTCAAIVALTALAAIIWQDGADSVRTAVERQNNASGDQSDSARSDFDLCVDGGGVWNYRTGKCARSPAGRGH